MASVRRPTDEDRLRLSGPGHPVRGGKGASVHVRSITTVLAQRGHHVVLVCARLGDGNAPPAVARIDEIGADQAGLDEKLEAIFSSEAVDVVPGAVLAPVRPG